MAVFRVCFSRITSGQPFQFCPIPLPDKAHVRDLPGNLHTIKATASAHRMMVMAFRFDVVSAGTESNGDSIILIIRDGVHYFPPDLRRLSGNAALIVWNERKVKC